MKGIFRLTGPREGYSPKSARFVVTATLVLAIAIAANTTVFSLLDGYLLHPLPYPDSRRLVDISIRVPKYDSDEAISPSVVMYEAIRRDCRALSAIAADEYHPLALKLSGSTRYVMGSVLTGNMLQLLGAKPVLGRAFTSRNNRPAYDYVAVISYRLWQSAFGANKAIVGSNVELGNHKYRVVGVMSRRFIYPGGLTGIWIPRPLRAVELLRSNTFNSWVGPLIGRLKPGFTRKNLVSELRYVRHRVLKRLPAAEREKYANAGFHFVVRSYRQTLLAQTGSHIRLLLFALLGAVLLLLLLASINIANLLLARVLARSHEMAMRRTLGATRLTLVRQLFREGLFLTLPGAVTGVGLAWLSLRVIAGSPFNPVGDPFRIGINWQIGGFVVAIVASIGILISLVPSWHVGRSDLKGLIQGGEGTATSSRGAQRMRDVIVALEIALASALLIGAGLLVHSFVNLQNVNPGFDASHVLAFRLLGRSQSRNPQPQHDGLRYEILRDVKALQGVANASMASWIPLDDYFGVTNFQISGHPSFSDPRPQIWYDSVTRGFFEMLQIPVLKGRTFNSTDTPTSQPVAVIGAGVAKRFFGQSDPVGQQLNLGAETDHKWVRVIGVVRPIKLELGGIAKPPPNQIYLSDTQFHYTYGQGMRLLVLTKGTDEVALLSAIKKVIHRVDPSLALYSSNLKNYNLEKLIALRSKRREMYMLVVVVFSAMALLLAITGIYGVLAYTIRERTRELRIRRVLGATRHDLRRLIIRHELRLFVAGVLVGIALAIGFGFSVTGLLFHVVPYDPISLIGGVLVVAAATLGASSLPRLGTMEDPGPSL